MTLKLFLILLPILLAIGALIRVLTSKSPVYRRKDRDNTGSTSAGGGDTGGTTTHSISDGHSKQGDGSGDSGADSGSGGDGGGGD
jgi:hypothetical protein